MTLELEAYQKRSEALSPQRYPYLPGFNGFRWRVVVTRNGAEILTTQFADSLAYHGSSFFVPVSGGSFSLWAVGVRYVEGFPRSSGWQRIKFRLIPEKDGSRLVVVDPVDRFPNAARNIRIRLHRVNPRGGPRVHPTRSSSLRPSPEIVTKTRITCRNRDGVFLTLSTAPYSAFMRTWSGVRTPNFGSKKRRTLPVNDHSVLLWNQSEPSQYHSQVHKTDLSDTNWWLEAFGDPDSLGLPGSISHDESARFQTIRRIIDRTGNGVEGNVAQDIVQMHQVVRTINDSVDRLTRAVRHVKRGNVPGAVDVLWNGGSPRYKKGKEPKRGGSLADNWLAFQYGWKPLLQDIDGAMRSLAEFNYANYAVRRVKASARTKVVTSRMVNSYTAHQVGPIVTTTISTCKIGLRYQLDDRLTAFLSQTGFTTPVNLIWEVLPYSFVVDWFLPIGPYLETLGAWDGLTFVDGYQVQHTKVIHQAAINDTWESGNYTHTVSGDYNAEGVRLDRAKLVSFPSAVFPSFKNPISTTHVLNAIALLRAAF